MTDLAARLRALGGWREIIERHRKKTDDPSITYVLKDGTRINENDSTIAKLAASLTRALEEISDVVNDVAAALEARPAPATEGEVERVGRALAASDAKNGRDPHVHYSDYRDNWHRMARAALSAARPSREGEMRALLEKVRTFLSVEYALPEIEAGHDGHPVDKAARKLWDEIHGTLQPQKEG